VQAEPAVRPLQVVHVIDGLEVGGAEVMLQRVLATSDRSRWAHQVVSLTTTGPVGDRIRALGVPITTLGMRPDPTAVVPLARLVRWLRSVRPDVVQTWLFESDLVGALATAGAGIGAPVVWGIQQSNLDPTLSKRHTRLVVQACARLSRRLPARIVCCSSRAAAIYADQGYDPNRMVVIPNGIDVDEFAPDPGARVSVRQELGVGADTPLVGLVARWDPQKDHQNFVRAAGEVARRSPGVHFLLCGKGVDDSNPDLSGWVRAEGLEHEMHLLGRRDDVRRIAAALDVAVSASAYGEGFPVAIVEAMASAVPCAVTDVGDCADMVADTGVVVPPHHPVALADAVLEVLTRRHDLGPKARERARAEYRLDGAVRQYESVWQSTLPGRP
jgi:glycosyltransferase involved in cell wall biosynthesis